MAAGADVDDASLLVAPSAGQVLTVGEGDLLQVGDTPFIDCSRWARGSIVCLIRNHVIITHFHCVNSLTEHKLKVRESSTEMHFECNTLYCQINYIEYSDFVILSVLLKLVGKH